jgi:two-component system chemotaxis sensor kinase CheA
MSRLLSAIVLPAEITAFELSYLKRMNRVALWFFALHVPLLCLFAWLNDTGPLLAGALSFTLLLGPVLAERSFDNPRHVSMVVAFTAMLMGGVLVHVGQGPVQIEMHFYFFALIAMLAVFANPAVILTAAATVAVHHLSVWWWLPKSVFNYEAPFWVVAVHAGFVVVESVAAAFISRSFFDNVIGLERIVQARTAALDERNRDMRLVLDNVSQGFVTIDREGVISAEKSAIVTTWFGQAEPGDTLMSYLGRTSPDFAARFGMAWAEVVEGVMPLELTLDQLPRTLRLDGRHLTVQVRSIGDCDPIERALVVISDATADVERARLEADQRDVMAIMERVANDKPSVLEFFEEAHRLMAVILDFAVTDVVTLKRAIHTLKGNALLFGVQTVGELCHQVESAIDDTGAVPSHDTRRLLGRAFERVCKSTGAFLGQDGAHKLEIDDDEYESILRELVSGAPREDLVRRIQAWKLEPASKRLGRVAEQARGIARRLNKGSITVDVEDNDILLDPQVWNPFWASFVHVVRNAVDHGLEDPDTRESSGKPRRGAISLVTRDDGEWFEVEVRDDGRGIDWDRLRQRAEQAGLPAASHEDLVEALFADGVTTKDSVTDVSGRGVGMGAVREACRERGGEVLVNSQAGGGTSIVFRFPRHAADNDIRGIAQSIAS